MKRRWVLPFVLLTLIGAACSKSNTTSNASQSPSATPSAAAVAAASYSVNVDGKNADIPESFLAYFPATVTAHAGDTINWNLQDTGEPHTVTLGTLTNAAVTAFEKITGTAQQGPPPPEDAALPQFTQNDQNGNPTLPPKLIPSASEPCSIATGAVPTATACPAGSTPSGTFNGTEAFYSSGWLAAGTPFSVKLASNIAPGTYKYMCLIHRAAMTGQIVVVDKSQPVPPADQQAAAGQQQLVSQTAVLQPAVTALATGKNPELKTLPSGPTHVLAGSGLQESADAIDQFGPAKVTATVGSTITWTLLGPHAIAFNAPTDAQGIHAPGSNQVNQKAVTPVGGPGQTSFPNPPNGPPSVVQTIKGGSFDGNGFRSSGLIFSFPPALIQYQLTFTAKGTFPYQCLVHDGMKGVITIQ